MLNTLQYLIVDEILLARVMEQKKPVWHARYRDVEDVLADTSDDEDLDNDYGDTEFDRRTGRPILA